MRNFIILTHRYLGIPLSVLFVVWFLSGIGMIYGGGIPSLAAKERLQHLKALDLSLVRITPADAAAISGVARSVRQASLLSVLGRPAYRFNDLSDTPITVFADSGEIFDGVDRDEGASIAAEFLLQSAQDIRYAGTVTEPDQWTLTEQQYLPLYRYDWNDEHATSAYVSPSRAEVVLVTTRQSRTLAWLSAIPHWFYFTPLRVRQPVWYRLVVWTSAAGCAVAALGLFLAVAQFRKTKPFRIADSVRYRGWSAWHYCTGAVFGIFVLTWIFSGLLSMDPFEWTNRTGLAIQPEPLAGEPGAFADYARIAGTRLRSIPGIPDAVRIDFDRIHGEPFFVSHRPDTAGISPTLVHARTLAVRSAPFPVEDALAGIRSRTDALIADHELLSEFDAYYYDRDGDTTLPVLRVKFDDPEQTWIYIELERGKIVHRTHRFGRIKRWLFNGLHSLDFSFWYHRRPLWDLGVILLSLGGLTTSALGLFLGFRRIAIAVSRSLRKEPLADKNPPLG